VAQVNPVGAGSVGNGAADAQEPKINVIPIMRLNKIDFFILFSFQQTILII
jgi:hypothetical protein